MLKINSCQYYLLNTSSLLVSVLFIAALLWISAISLTNTANAVMHEAGLAASNNMTQANNSNNAATQATEGQESSNATASTVVRDSVFAYLEGRVIPSFDFIHLYDTTPYMIMDGHVAAKLPCNEQSQTPLRILIGQAPNMTFSALELVETLSEPGQTCMYHADLHSAHVDQQGTAEGRIITDIAIMNPTLSDIQLPVTSTVVIGVNEIMPLDEGAHEEHGVEPAGAGVGEEHVH